MTLNDIISFNKEFKSGINLYLSLNKPEKVQAYIPTASSLRILDDYLQSVLYNKEQATLLIGPYGKGKSHLLLVLLAILSMKRNKKNEKVIDSLLEKIGTDEEQDIQVREHVKQAWSENPFLPVVLNSTGGDLKQAFLMALNDALIRAKLDNLVPDTFYSIALQRIEEWNESYPETYEKFKQQLERARTNIDEFIASLKMFSSEALELFKKIYPTITAGSEFNPLAASEVLPLYRNISDQLVENYKYSGIYIVFDEFSKFIEGQDGKAVGNNMKLLQDICELSVDSQNSKVFITLIAHKSIKEYGKYLSQETINAFTGIEGRIIEKYFVTSIKNNYELVKNAIIKKDGFEDIIPNGRKLFGKKAADMYYSIPAFRAKFQKKDFVSIILRGCFPLNPIAAYILLNISEKVAQNERTLFTFVSNDEPNSLARYVRNHEESGEWSVGADLVYDYFQGLFKKEVGNELIHSIWLSSEYALEKCNTSDEKKVLKALAVILAVNKEEEISATDAYLKIAVSVDDYDSVIRVLKDEEIIYKRRATDSYAFKTKAGSTLKTEIKKQRELRGDNANYSAALDKISDVNYIIPRKYNTDFKMTRYFDHEFMSVEAFLDISEARIILDGSLDGKVIKLYSFNPISQMKVKKHYKKLACERLIVVVPQEGLNIKKQLVDYEILQVLRNSASFSGDDEILRRELPIIEDDITQEVEDVLAAVYGKDSESIVLYHKDGNVVEGASGTEELAVNNCCRALYDHCPIINNEIINRNTISSSQTKKTRISIISTLLSHLDSEEYYTGTNQEATVFRSLFVRTGLKGKKVLPDKNLLEVINIINSFIDACSDNKMSVKGLIQQLTSKPYGMRKGILSIYLACVFADRKEDLIFYLSGMEVQLSPNVLVNLVDNPDQYALFVSKEDVEKEKYISELNEMFHVADQRNLTESRIKNIVICMQRWFRSLPQISRNMADINYIAEYVEISSQMNGLKNLLQRVEINPYEMLFVSLPDIFGTKDFCEIEGGLDTVVTAFEDYLDRLIMIVANKTYEIFGGRKRKDLYHVLKEWYKKQSSLSKEGLHDGKTTALMSFISNLDIYDDFEIIKRIAKVVTDVYIDNWIDGTVDEYTDELRVYKMRVEEIKDEVSRDKLKLSFVGTNGKEIERFYDRAPEGTGMVLRNIIEDTLDEYDDLSVNDRVSILLDMIEKIIGEKQ